MCKQIFSRIYAAAKRQQREGGNFMFPWFCAAVVEKTVPETGYEGLAYYSLELQCQCKWEILQRVATDF